MDVLAVLSALCGWVYTLCWSLSFYPQPVLNRRRCSTKGTTIDFPFINALGFAAYLASTLALRFSSTVRADYAARHHGLTPTVALNDVAFAAHGLILTLVTLSQYVMPQWWGWPTRSDTDDDDDAGFGTCDAGRRPSRPSRPMAGLALTCIGVVAMLAIVVGARRSAGKNGENGENGKNGASWLDVVYALGYVKLVVTLVKYAPQVVANWRNGSTVGWSIAQILLDVAGGALSIAQLALDSWRQHDWSGVTGNPVKLGLGNVSMAYDCVFVVQHYVLYRGVSQGSDAEAGTGRGAEASAGPDTRPAAEAGRRDSKQYDGVTEDDEEGGRLVTGYGIYEGSSSGHATSGQQQGEEEALLGQRDGR